MKKTFSDVSKISINYYPKFFLAFLPQWVIIHAIPILVLLLVNIFASRNLTFVWLSTVGFLMIELLYNVYVFSEVTQKREGWNFKNTFSVIHFLKFIFSPSKLFLSAKYYMKLFRTRTLVNFETVATQISDLTKPNPDFAISRPETYEKYYPYFLDKYTPFLILENISSDKLFSLDSDLNQEQKDRINAYIQEERLTLLFPYFALACMLLGYFLIGGHLTSFILQGFAPEGSLQSIIPISPVFIFFMILLFSYPLSIASLTYYYCSYYFFYKEFFT